MQSPPDRSRRQHGGFTLLELVLVLSVLAVVAALTWPSLMRYLREQKVQEGAEAARAAASRTRINAIDTGLTYQFRYEPGGRRFCVVPFDSPANIEGSASDPAGDDGISKFPVLSGQLSETSQFVPPDDDSGGVLESLGPESFADLPDAGELAATTWGPPILFYPDGTAIDATFSVTDEEQQRIELTIRGLTGTLSVSPLMQEGEG